MLAAKEGNLELCLKLVELGASVNSTDVVRMTNMVSCPLHVEQTFADLIGQ